MSIVPQVADATVQGEVGTSTGMINITKPVEPILSQDYSSSKSKKGGKSLGKELAAVAGGFILTWFIFWAYLTWDNFSSHYSADSLANRAKAATLFVIQIMSLYFLVYGGLMYYWTRESVYMTYIIIAVAFILIAILGTSLEWLST